MQFKFCMTQKSVFVITAYFKVAKLSVCFLCACRNCPSNIFLVIVEVARVHGEREGKKLGRVPCSSFSTGCLGSAGEAMEGWFLRQVVIVSLMLTKCSWLSDSPDAVGYPSPPCE